MGKSTYIKVGNEWKNVVNIYKKTTNGWVDNVIPKIKINNDWKDCITYELTDIQIGDEMEGGKVAYLGSEGDFENGMIAAAADTSTGHQWGCRGTTIGGAATATAIGTGKAATEAIVNGCDMNESLVAAKLCNNLTLNGYSDWFLPSEQELNQMYQNKGDIDGFASAVYWSSSESSSSIARMQIFSNGYFGNTYKNYSRRVRAVRGF